MGSHSSYRDSGIGHCVNERAPTPTLSELAQAWDAIAKSVVVSRADIDDQLEWSGMLLLDQGDRHCIW